MTLFDECYHTLPPEKVTPEDFEKFWAKQLKDLKKVPFEIESKRKVSTKILKENQLQLSFLSAGKHRIEAMFLSPKKMRGKPPLVLVFGDYHQEPSFSKGLLNAGIAQVVIKLRGHEKVLETTETKKTETSNETEEGSTVAREPETYGYFAENLLEPENYYMTLLMQDAYRALEAMRLRKEIDTEKIGVWGKGIGVPMALFTAAFSNRVSSLFLERPAFVYLDLTQNKSKAKYAQEINRFLKNRKRNKLKMKENLSYNDGLGFAGKVKKETAISVNLESETSNPHGAFALFHALQAEKEMHLFTEDSEETIEKEKKLTAQKAVQFFVRTLRDD